MQRDKSMMAGYRPVDEAENKQILLDMLKYIHDFCEENDIRYFLYFGTLLGAVRHKGFIPWDDDADICMTRTEYEKFAKIFNTNSSGRYRLVDVKDDRQYTPYPKIVDEHTFFSERGDKPFYINIDLFIIDNEGHTYAGAQRFLHFISFFIWQIIILRKPKTGRTAFRRAICRMLSFLLRPIGEKRLLHLIDFLSARNRSTELWEYVGSVNASLYNERQILRGEWFRECGTMEFEGYSFCVPKHYHEILTGIYRDYMTPPPEDKRLPTHSGCGRWIREDEPMHKEETL